MVIKRDAAASRFVYPRATSTATWFSPGQSICRSRLCGSIACGLELGVSTISPGEGAQLLERRQRRGDPHACFRAPSLPAKTLAEAQLRSSALEGVQIAVMPNERRLKGELERLRRRNEPLTASSCRSTSSISPVVGRGLQRLERKARLRAPTGANVRLDEVRAPIRNRPARPARLPKRFEVGDRRIRTPETKLEQTENRICVASCVPNVTGTEERGRDMATALELAPLSRIDETEDEKTVRRP